MTATDEPTTGEREAVQAVCVHDDFEHPSDGSLPCHLTHAPRSLGDLQSEFQAFVEKPWRCRAEGCGQRFELFSESLAHRLTHEEAAR